MTVKLGDSAEETVWRNSLLKDDLWSWGRYSARIVKMSVCLSLRHLNVGSFVSAQLRGIRGVSFKSR